jgi:hypothetical protein
MFQRIGDIIEDQRGLRAGIDELKTLQEAAGVRGQEPRPEETPIKFETVSPNLSAGQDTSPEPFIVTVSDIESLYATNEEPAAQVVQPDRNWDQDDASGPPRAISQQQETPVTPGEAWICNRNGRCRYGSGTDEALEQWRAASEASSEQQAQRQRGVQDPQRQEPKNPGLGTENSEDGRRHRSVTQPHEVGFGRRPSQPTLARGDQRDSHQGY